MKANYFVTNFAVEKGGANFKVKAHLTRIVIVADSR